MSHRTTPSIIDDLTAAELDRFRPKYTKGGGCWIWTGSIGRGGYGRFWRTTAKVNQGAHRLSYHHHVGPIPLGLDVLHSCDVPACVNPAHLRAATHAENMAEMAAKRRNNHPIGERHPLAKLSAEDVRTIHDRLAEGSTCTELGRAYGVTRQAIASIRAGRNWPHILAERRAAPGGGA